MDITRRLITAAVLAGGLAMVPACAAQAPVTKPAEDEELTIRPTGIKKEEVRALPSAVADVVPAAGGRYLLLHLKKLRKLAAFDVNTGKIAKYISLPSDDILYAAGAEVALVVDRSKNTLIRYSLKTMKAELTNTIPVRGQAVSIAMGCASAGPAILAVRGEDGDSEIHFVDVRRFKAIDVEFADRERNSYRDHYGRMETRASADGSVFTVTSEEGAEMIEISGKKAKRTPMRGDRMAWYTSPLLPGPQGRTFYAGPSLFDREMKPLDKRDVEQEPSEMMGAYLPALQGSYFLGARPSLRRDDGGVERDGGLKLSVHVNRSPRPLVELGEMKAIDLRRLIEDRMRGMRRDESAGLSLDKRIIFIPAAELLIVIPASNDKVHLRRLNVLEELKSSKIDYFFVDSSPVTAARAGQTYTYPVKVYARKGGVKYKLESAPDGMKISADGTITWRVPADLAADQTAVILLINDAAGQEVYHSFTIKIVPKTETKD
ncbi:MAG TPA: putative Ig domain-containing protein [Phycisphaerae bacterium]|nr:putative Ig domain-containing protein [Phycisphaerae bacterium]